MPLVKKPKRELRPHPASFRLSDDEFVQLKVLARLFNETDIGVISVLLLDAHSKHKKRHAKDCDRFEKEIREEIKDKERKPKRGKR